MNGSDSRRRVPKKRTHNDRPPLLPSDYLRVRDFEYVQPLYDLAFLLEVDALAQGEDVPKYRTFSLWRAALSLDGYSTTIDRWLDGTIDHSELDAVPSPRIRQYLTSVRATGSLPELRPFAAKKYNRCLRLRSVRGLGPSKIALTLMRPHLAEHLFREAAMDAGLDLDRIRSVQGGQNIGPWQSAHIVPPLLRFLHTVERAYGRPIRWTVDGMDDPLLPITRTVSIGTPSRWISIVDALQKGLRKEKHFLRDGPMKDRTFDVRHRMGWRFAVQSTRRKGNLRTVGELAHALDPLARRTSSVLRSDLHLHSVWSDGSASISQMAKAAVGRGLEHIAVTDHSRSAKIQGGLTPVLWLRQAHALRDEPPVCPVLHGIEVDILKDGSLDLPHSLLAAAGLVVASVHSNWTDNSRVNTDRLLRAIDSGVVDVLGHPTTAVVGKPGVPDYYRPPADVLWSELFDACAHLRVAVEFNCFPSRLDLSVALLEQAANAGCALSFGSDSHARSHLLNLGFAEAVLDRVEAKHVLNSMTHPELRTWIAGARKHRRALTGSLARPAQAELALDDAPGVRIVTLKARISPPAKLPAGSKVIGVDLTAGRKASGVALLDGTRVETCSLVSDQEIVQYVRERRPNIVSIDSPLGIPGGGESPAPNNGIVRMAEHDLASIGISAYPALIDSMKPLTMRGIRLRRILESLEDGPLVIESYPGAAQDVLSIPRKQKGLNLLRGGLRRLGLTGPGLESHSHDEIDAITSAIVARYYECGSFQALGTPVEAQLIVPAIRPLTFQTNPIICLAGRTAAGKSVTARYLGVFYGFKWLRTRDIIRQLFEKDLLKRQGNRIYPQEADVGSITEKDLQDFGLIVLNRYQQRPLRASLAQQLAQCDGPVVVDAIRELSDVDANLLEGRRIIIWFIDCTETLIQQRLAKRATRESGRMNTASPVDQTATSLRRCADDVISNDGTLEELRWGIDDRLFAMIDATQLTTDLVS